MKGADEIRSTKSLVSSEGDGAQSGNNSDRSDLGSSPADTRHDEKAPSSGKKRKAQTTNQDGKDDRRAANRLSAFQSRQRRKMIIEDLQTTVAEQSKNNADQAKQIAELKRQIQAARRENELLRGQVGSAATSMHPAAAPLLGGLRLFAPNHPLAMSQPQHTGIQEQQQQQNQFLQNTMLQNALLMSAAQAQLGGRQNGAFNLLNELGAMVGQTSNTNVGQDPQNVFSANQQKTGM
uniref:BZIP domain-containing protein n=1 Tax=Amphora coffeiformis TaxID=265554 RepID=A0A7S3P497_9STRA|mmetsp:Transcript_17671/g.33519  ORF Transcript_17671/g.33519 Transcript_17671/m.33519 type:complete len:236 (+) Transcript_17671:67-774(+)